MSVVLFLLGGVTAGKSIIFCFAGAGLSLLAGIGAVWVGRQGPPPRSSLPAIVVTISLVLLMSFVVTLFYIGSQLRNFANQ